MVIFIFSCIVWGRVESEARMIFSNSWISRERISPSLLHFSIAPKKLQKKKKGIRGGIYASCLSDLEARTRSNIAFCMLHNDGLGTIRKRGLESSTIEKIGCSARERRK